MRIVKYIGLVILVLLAISTAVTASYLAGRVPERESQDYQSRMHYLPISKQENTDYRDGDWFWPFSYMNNPYMVDGPYLLTYPLPLGPAAPAIVIMPGGGYMARAETKEGIEIAQWLNQNGIAAVVLNYRLKHHPAPLNDAQMAIQWLRAHAPQYNVDPDRIGVMGFSAGGHLAAAASTLYQPADPSSTDLLKRYSSRPDFSVLAYAVVSFQEIGHQGSLENLLGENPDQSVIDLLSAEMQVSSDTPPAFIWSSKADPVVPYEQSILYAQALEKAGVAHRLELFPEGSHGSALAQDDEYASVWPQQLLEWLRLSGFL